MLSVFSHLRVRSVACRLLGTPTAVDFQSCGAPDLNSAWPQWSYSEHKLRAAVRDMPDDAFDLMKVRTHRRAYTITHTLKICL